MLSKITDEVYLDPKEVVSVERYKVKEDVASSPYESRYIITFDGSKIILKNGTEILVDDVMPDEIIKKLQQKIEADHEKN
ncbi:MAG: hypothetical protein ACK5QX_07425 [bacterium]